MKNDDTVKKKIQLIVQLEFPHNGKIGSIKHLLNDIEITITTVFLKPNVVIVVGCRKI